MVFSSTPTKLVVAETQVAHIQVQHASPILALQHRCQPPVGHCFEGCTAQCSEIYLAGGCGPGGLLLR